MKRLGNYGWHLIAVIALGVPLITFLVFEKWFLVPLPKGPLEAWLGY
jgi:putative tricarboxylic transport membrane protein